MIFEEFYVTLREWFFNKFGKSFGAYEGDVRQKLRYNYVDEINFRVSIQTSGLRYYVGVN